MKRKVIHIDQTKCNGCGQCILACRESAIGFENGKAKLMREDHCDGLGQCLPVCLTGAISFVEKDVPDAADAGVDTAATSPEAQSGQGMARSNAGGGCPGMMARPGAAQWPLQIKLVPPVADFYADADLLVAADCCAYTYPQFQKEYAEGKVRLIGCPKLDEVDYAEKLGEIFAGNDIKSVTVTRMEVPCCDGIESAVGRALAASGKDIPVRSVVFSVEGTRI